MRDMQSIGLHSSLTSALPSADIKDDFVNPKGSKLSGLNVGSASHNDSTPGRSDGNIV